MSLNKLDKIMRYTEVRNLTHAYDYVRRTHVETLADGSPKSRRRVRRTLDLVSPGFLLDVEVKEAQEIARANERKEAQKVAAERAKTSPSS